MFQLSADSPVNQEFIRGGFAGSCIQHMRPNGRPGRGGVARQAKDRVPHKRTPATCWYCLLSWSQTGCQDLFYAINMMGAPRMNTPLVRGSHSDGIFCFLVNVSGLL